MEGCLENAYYIHYSRLELDWPAPNCMFPSTIWGRTHIRWVPQIKFLKMEIRNYIPCELELSLEVKHLNSLHSPYQQSTSPFLCPNNPTNIYTINESYHSNHVVIIAKAPRHAQHLGASLPNHNPVQPADNPRPIHETR